jgi:Flp pilus assembly protein TadD
MSSPALANTHSPSTDLKSRAWVISPVADIGIFVATPLVLAFGFRMFLTAAMLPILKLIILGISSTGHHLPGLIRAYTDKFIFERFRWRLILVPSLFILLAGVCAFFQLSYMLFALLTWSIWHGAMQIMGFLRISDAKAGLSSRLTATLDFWICMTWFVQVMFWSPSRSSAIFSSFYLAGGTVIPARPMLAIEMAWLFLTYGVTAVYAVNLLYNGLRLGYWNLPKLANLLASLAFWAWCMLGVENIIVGLIMWEIFHDLQYNVFVWNYNHTRVAKGLSQSPLERYLFRADAKTIAIYAGCIVLYGCLGVYSRDIINIYENQDIYNSWITRFGNIFAASGLIHFYTDGFIWKVRDQKVRQDLGLTGGGTSFMRRSNWLHMAMVMVFFGAGTLMAASEYRNHHQSGGRGKPDNLADLVPKSGYANFMKATRLRVETKFDSAEIYYLRAINADSNYAFAQSFVAEIETDKGNWGEAVNHYEVAVQADPENLVARENLGALYLQTGAFEKGQVVYQELARLDSANPEYSYQIGLALLNLHKGLSAKQYFIRSLYLDSAQPKALNYLGMVQQALGYSDSAIALYRRALLLDSTYEQAQANLASLEGPSTTSKGKPPSEKGRAPTR